uniref:Uncharacterized protein C21orf2 n=1 Tax=Aceria tosichella TaxID=561515 RepID=A0A6G1S6L9_9ACAR
MSLVLNESVVLAKTRSQDLKSVLKLNCWGCGIKDVSLVRQLINVEVIGLSCNEITTLEDFAYCKKLKELILRGNRIKNISEIAHLQKLPNLTSLWLQENPCVESTYNYRKVVLKALPQLKVLDNQPVTREELQEIEELGNEIYEEIPYESSSSHSSGPPSHAGSGSGAGGSCSAGPNTVSSQQSKVPTGSAAVAPRQTSQSSVESQPDGAPQAGQQQQPTNEHHQHAISHIDQSFNEMSVYQPANTLASNEMNDTMSSNYQYTTMNDSTSLAMNRSSRLLQAQSQGSMNALNGSGGGGAGGNHQFSAWPGTNNLNNNNNSISMLPKGGKNRNANILSAVLCLVKELDYVSCEVVQTALHCRMEETSQ